MHLAASGGQFSEKLSDAVGRATDAEIRIMSDLVDRGMTIPELVNLLQGAHVLVGDDTRYQAWIFPTSRRRLSSHHRNVDKRATPDYGYDGPLVRESLHGKATIGTWVQFERTKATFRWGQFPPGTTCCISATTPSTGSPARTSAPGGCRPTSTPDRSSCAPRTAHPVAER